MIIEKKAQRIYPLSSREISPRGTLLSPPELFLFGGCDKCCAKSPEFHRRGKFATTDWAHVGRIVDCASISFQVFFPFFFSFFRFSFFQNGDLAIKKFARDEIVISWIVIREICFVRHRFQIMTLVFNRFFFMSKPCFLFK